MKISILACLACAFALFAAAPQGLRGQDAPGAGFVGFDFIDDALDRAGRAFDADALEPTLEDSYFLGRAVAAHIFATHAPYTQNPELTRYLNKIAQVLAINSPRPVAFRGYFVVILDCHSFNAFASPGGHIFLTRGLVEAATSEDMLAAAIAHEMAHIILEHGLGMIKAMSVYGEMQDIANRAAAFAGNPPAAQRLLSFRDSVSGLLEAMVKSGYSQEKEFAADRMTVELLAAAGYDPRAMVEVLQILQRMQGSRSDGFFSTHPPPADRIRNAEAAIRQLRVPDTRPHRQARFQGSRN